MSESNGSMEVIAAPGPPMLRLSRNYVKLNYQDLQALLGLAEGLEDVTPSEERALEKCKLILRMMEKKREAQDAAGEGV